MREERDKEDKKRREEDLKERERKGFYFSREEENPKIVTFLK